MILKETLNWLEKVYVYPVPKDYIEFIKIGDFESSCRKHYIVGNGDEGILEISEWFTPDILVFVYGNCIEEEIIKPHYLPIFDSCNLTVVIDCDPNAPTYGQVFTSSPDDGYFDVDLDKNVYEDLNFVAKSFLEIISNLKTTEELETMGVW